MRCKRGQTVQPMLNFLATRRFRRAWVAALHAEGMTVIDVKRLARYNTRVSQGILHSAGWMTQMADLQARYNRAHDAVYRATTTEQG
jgi:hypothetical protein